MFYEQEEVRKLLNDLVTKHRESVPGRHTTSAHLYNLKEGFLPEGTYRLNFYSTGGVFHNCWIAFTISEDGWIRSEHCWDAGMVQLEKVVFDELEEHFRREGVKTTVEFEDALYKNRLRGRKRKLHIEDSFLVPETLETAYTGSSGTIDQIPHDVFVSYASRDKPLADAIVSRLEMQGIRCWIAPRDILPGRPYQSSLVHALESTTLMILLFSAFSNRSLHVKRELDIAVNAGAIIIPFRLENVPLSPEMQYLVATQHWIDALTPPVEQHIQELCKTVKHFLDEKKKGA